ncbi:MAG: gas vesicle protein K [Desulfobacteraceae bacterium]|nr:gas vesicle protein K [Desulfobacteraceae bacterium]MCF8050311.1 gas vesicle protein K [Desulfobacterales bacterium]MCF8080429.1 gas vesicle protein K [Desulfobacterales bacterium]
MTINNLQAKVESETLDDFARVMQSGQWVQAKGADGINGVESTCISKGRLKLNPENVKNGLGQLVLTLVKLLHELLERQALQRIEAGSLNDDDIENLGLTLMKQAEEIERLRKEFNLDEEDLNMDLGPLGKLL